MKKTATIRINSWYCAYGVSHESFLGGFWNWADGRGNIASGGKCVKAPEIDVGAGGGAIALLVGGLLLAAEKRRRSSLGSLLLKPGQLGPAFLAKIKRSH